MKNKIYAIIFCLVTFFMLLSIVFSIMDKVFGIDNMFSSNKNAVLFLVSGIIISVILTFSVYVLVFFIQVYLGG